MCLTIDTKVIAPVTKRNYFVGYKVIQNYGDCLSAWFTGFEYKVGKNVAKVLSEAETAYNKDYGIITGGAFHVWLRKEDAVAFLKNNSHHKTARLIPVRCYFKDVVAYGTNFNNTQGAAVKNIYIDKRTYDKAIKEPKEKEHQSVSND